MNVCIDLPDFTIKITGADRKHVDHAYERFDNYYDANGLNFMYVEEQKKGTWTVETNWSADCTLPTPETLKEQFEGWLAEESWKEGK